MAWCVFSSLGRRNSGRGGDRRLTTWPGDVWTDDERAAFGGRTTHLDLCPCWIRRFCVLSWNFGAVALGLGEKDTLGSLVPGVCGFGIFDGGVRHPRGGQVVEAEKDETWRGLVLLLWGGLQPRAPKEEEEEEEEADEK